MRTAIDELRKNASKLVVSPTSGNKYLIRRINQIDFNRAQINSIIPAEDVAPTDPRFMSRVIDSMQYTLERGARVFFGPEADTPEDWIHADWIAGDEGWLSDEILKFSGLDTESQQKLKDLLKNANGSEPSTVSAANTDDSPAS